ncbi:MAG TPA: WYL domain-containing protein [Gemmatimonadaceae bacterium]|nr:WYL domain-containing protein [Gemmatimonadaceae bacterium]
MSWSSRSARRPPASKLQRWVDLISALLGRRFPRTFAEIATEVPAYRADGKSPATLKRMFERDKDELRRLGVPIETVGAEGAEDTAYRLRNERFYLPYLTLVSARGARSTPRRVERFGYRALGEASLDPDELAAIGEAAARARQLGDPELAAHAESALRKLAFDLPVDAVSAAEPHVVPSRASADPAALAALGQALVRRKRVTFTYRSMGRDTVEERTVEPWGLFFVSGHWYLAARDAERDGVRNFRVSRVREVRVNPHTPQSADYAIDADFDLREHARSRQAWELGDGDAVEARVRFAGASGVATAGRSLGDAVEGVPEERRFQVRRPDAFARWLLSFAGEAEPVAPPSLVEGYRALAAETLVRYGAVEGAR